MRVLQINSVCGQGSTGRICVGIADLLKSKGHSAYIAYAHGQSDYPDSFNFSGGKVDYYGHNILSRLTDSEGLHSRSATNRLISKIRDINPDIIHIHTLHGHYVNYEILLKYIDTLHVPVVLTLHDCWTFTGHCAHFDMFGCDKWKKECRKCEHLDTYPQSWLVDNSERNFKLKKELFAKLGERLTIVPVSYWLENFVKQSFFKEQKIITIHNGINLNQFKPALNTDLRVKYNVGEKKIILGVALPWSEYKGLPDFVRMRQMLNDDYTLIMVGLTEKQKQDLPHGIIGITRTDNISQLVELYSAADVFVNTTYCDNYPTVNLEAISCGTPVITYKTGGSPESISQETGAVVDQGDLESLVLRIKDICNADREEYRKHCQDYSVKNFDQYSCFQNYISIYEYANNK